MAAILLLAGLAIGACASRLSVDPGGSPTAARAGFRYVALGDSYTIGTATRSERERWPNQLVERLAGTPAALELVGNLGVNGFTSRDLIEAELPRLDALEPELVSVLIGVNDVVQDVPDETYAANVATILDAVLERVEPGRVFVVTTPDYTVTPQGAEYGDPRAKASAIVAFNEILTGAARARGIAVIDIHDISLEAATDPSLVADDGLHPSGAQYGRWVERIGPAVEAILGR